MPVGTSVCTAPVLLAAMGVMKRELERQEEAWLDAWDSAEFEEAAWQAEAAEMEEAAGSTQGAPVGHVLLATMIAQEMAPDNQPTGQMAAEVAPSEDATREALKNLLEESVQQADSDRGTVGQRGGGGAVGQWDRGPWDSGP